MMLCPLKFARYEFEGGTDCIGAECGFYGGVCMDATNGMRGETNGIADGITLPDGDAVDMLRKYVEECESANGNAGTRGKRLLQIADMVERDYVRRDEPCTSEGKNVQGLPDENVLYLLRDVVKKSDGHTLYHGVTKLMQAIGKEPEDRRETGSELAIALNTLADMVERDYVRRESIEEVMDTDRELVAENIRLRAERDEWKAKVKTLADYSRYWRGRCAKLEYRSDKRAAAVERLKGVKQATDENLLDAILGAPAGLNLHGAEKLIALKDLLTDDDAHSTTEPKLSEQSESLSDESDSREKLDYGDVIQFIREKVDIVIDQLVDDELYDSREKINALRAYYGAGPTAMTDEQIAAGREVYGAKKDVDMVIVDELRIDEPDTIRNEQIDNGQLAPEPDSREKLEAELDNIISDALRNLRRAIYQCVEQRMDVLSFSDGEFIDFEHEEFVGEYVERAMKVLDRQAAIVERECAFKLHEILGEINE